MIVRNEMGFLSGDQEIVFLNKRKEKKTCLEYGIDREDKVEKGMEQLKKIPLCFFSTAIFCESHS